MGMSIARSPFVNYNRDVKRTIFIIERKKSARHVAHTACRAIPIPWR